MTDYIYFRLSTNFKNKYPQAFVLSKKYSQAEIVTETNSAVRSKLFLKALINGQLKREVDNVDIRL